MLAFARPWRHSIGGRDAFAILLYGISLGAMNLLFYASLKTIPFGVAVAIEFTGPLGVAILSSRRKIDFLWIVLAALGLILIAPLRDVDAALDLTGCAYAFAAGLCWALYIVFGHRLTHLEGGQSTSLGMTTAALVAIPFGWTQAGTKLFSPGVLAIGLVVGVLSSALPYSLEMIALKRLPRRTFSILLSLEPALAALAGLVFLHEQLSVAQWIAIACVMGASIGSATTATR
jgi:inner membrane transporter RhtA